MERTVVHFTVSMFQFIRPILRPLLNSHIKVVDCNVCCVLLVRSPVSLTAFLILLEEYFGELCSFMVFQVEVLSTGFCILVHVI